MVADPGVGLARLLTRDVPRAPGRDALEAWGRAVGGALHRPAVVTLEGELGAGKTTLVRALCAGLGVADLHAVTSPTFSLVQQYPSPGGAIVHVDLYRLRSDAELDALGWDELVGGASILFVEWPERARHTLPPDTIRIMLSHDDSSPARRLLQVVAPSPG